MSNAESFTQPAWGINGREGGRPVLSSIPVESLASAAILLHIADMPPCLYHRQGCW